MWWRNKPLSEEKRTALAAKAHQLAKAKQWKRAEALIARAMTGPVSHDILAHAFHVQLSQQHYDAAQGLALQRLQLCGPDAQTKQTSDCYDHLAFVCKGQGRNDEAETYFLRCLAIGEALLLPNHIGVYCAHLGNLKTAAKQYEEADSFYHRALSIDPPINRDAQVMAKEGLFFSCFQQRNFEDAIPLGEDCLVYYQVRNDLSNSARISCFLASCFLQQGQLAQSETHVSYAFKIFRDLGDTVKMAAAYNDLAIVELRMGNHSRAESLLKRALEINEKSGTGRGIARQYINFATVALSLDDVFGAKAFCEKANTYVTEGPEFDELRWILKGHAALIALELYDFDESQETLQELIRHYQTAKNYKELARYSSFLATSYEVQERYEEGITLRVSVVEICQQHRVVNELAEHTGRLSNTYRLVGRLDEADSTLIRAKNEMSEDQKANLSMILRLQACTCLRRQNFERGLTLVQRTIPMFDPREAPAQVIFSRFVEEALLFCAGDLKQADARFAQSLRLAQEAGIVGTLASLLCGDARRWVAEGEISLAQRLCAHLDSFKFNDPNGFIAAQRAVIEGRIALARNDVLAADRHLDKALELCAKHDLMGLASYVACQKKKRAQASMG